MASTGDIGVGSFIRFNGELCQILEYQHRTPGNLRAFFQAKMRNLKTGKLVEYRFRAGESVDPVRVEFRPLQYIFAEDNNIVCMDKDTFEQVYIPGSFLGDARQFLKEGVDITIAFEGDEPITAQMPQFVELEVAYTEPGLKGDTATNTLKPAKLETGAEIKVPLFINTGDKIRVDTRTGAYSERVK
jgi:elongation factor P